MRRRVCGQRTEFFRCPAHRSLLDRALAVVTPALDTAGAPRPLDRD